MSVHIVPAKTYVAVWAALIGLTILTTLVAFVDMGAASNVVAMAIAITKAALVVLFFMGLRHAARLNTVVVLSSLLWLVILVSITLADYFTRGWLGAPGR